MTHSGPALPQLRLLSTEQCETIHLAALELLRRTGVRVHHPEALALLRQTDAVITDETLVRFPALEAEIDAILRRA